MIDNLEAKLLKRKFKQVKSDSYIIIFGLPVQLQEWIKKDLKIYVDSGKQEIYINQMLNSQQLEKYYKEVIKIVGSKKTKKKKKQAIKKTLVKD